MAAGRDRNRESLALEERLAAFGVVAFDFASDLAAHIPKNSDRSPDSSKPSKDYFADHTNRNKIEVVVSLAAQSLEGLRNGCEMES